MPRVRSWQHTGVWCVMASVASCGGSAWQPAPVPASVAVSDCGPASAQVDYVVDGDTYILQGGQTVRLRAVDAPEYTETEECYGFAAREAALALLQDHEISLQYSEPCRDRFDRLLASVQVQGHDLASWLVEKGYACYVAWDAADASLQDLAALQVLARTVQIGNWDYCLDRPCLPSDDAVP